MKTTFTRRIVAAIAAAGLLLVGAPLAAGPAQGAVQSCPASTTCNGALTGSLGSTAYTITMPAKFNGTVLLWSHGYRISTPIPAALAVPLGLASSVGYQKISFPAFTPVFGTDVAYIGSGAAEVADDQAVIDKLLAQGYALTGVGYSRQGWSTPEAVQANELMIRHINAGAVKGAKKIMVWGESFGALVAATVAERNPTKVAGLLPTCGVLAGPEQAMNTAMTVLYSWKTLVAPSLRVANYTSYAQALTDLGTVLQTLQGVGNGTVSVSSVGYPVAQANLLAGLMGGLPDRVGGLRRRDGQPGLRHPRHRGCTRRRLPAGIGGCELGGGHAPERRRCRGPGRSWPGTTSSSRHASWRGSRPTESANFTDNVNVAYSKLLSDEQRGEFGDTLNASTVMPNLLNAMLAKLDASKGDAATRFPANAEGREGHPCPARSDGGVHGADGADLDGGGSDRSRREHRLLRRQADGIGEEGRHDAARGGVLHDAAAERVDGVRPRRQVTGRGCIGCRSDDGYRALQLDAQLRPAGRECGVRPQPDRQQPHLEGPQGRQPAHVGHCGRER